jgi:hypothetical protein
MTPTSAFNSILLPAKRSLSIDDLVAPYDQTVLLDRIEVRSAGNEGHVLFYPQ